MSEILALEGEWEKNPKDKTSIRSILKFLDDVSSIEFYHRRGSYATRFLFLFGKG